MANSVHRKIDAVLREDGYITMTIGPILENIAIQSNQSVESIVTKAKHFFSAQVSFCREVPVGLLEIVDLDQKVMARLMIDFHVSQCFGQSK